MRKFITLRLTALLLFLGLFHSGMYAQLSLTNGASTATIDFSATTQAGVGTNSGTAFTGAGFSPDPTSATAGRLNSNAWAVTGWSDGSMPFGNTAATANTDYTRGSTAVAVTTGGMYAFTGAPASVSNPMLWFQPGGSDFAPGTITLRIKNNGTTNITQLALSYNLYVRNDQARSSSFNFSYSADNTTYTSASALDYTSTAAVDALGVVWVGGAPKATTITGLNIAPGAFYYIRWSSADVGGAGSRDEFGLDDIKATATYQVSTDASLSALSVSAGSVSPAFSPLWFSYSLNVNNAVASTTVTALANDAAATIKVNGVAVASGSSSSSIPLNVGSNLISTVVTAGDLVTTQPYYVNINRAAPATPILTIGTPLTGFGNICTGTSGGTNSFVINGNDLDGSAITIAALPGFSFAETAGGSFTSTLSFTSGAVISSKQIFVKFDPVAVQSYDGNILVSGGSAATLSVAVTASGINTSASVVTGSNIVAGTSASLNGSITTIGCGAVTSYGFEYSTSSGFANGTGTQVLASNLSSGAFSKTIAGLTGATTYYYKAFAINNAGTAYGTENSFATSSVVPVVMSAQPLLRYTENFTSIGSWTDNFTSGTGANHFSSVAVNTTGSIPSATRITTSSAAFSSSSSGGVQKGTGNIVLLATGGTDNSSSVAFEFYMDFTGMNAGTLSFDWASVNNSTGNRNGSLRVYGSTDGISYTELASADVINFTNNIPSTGTVNSVALPASFNNSSTARLRFYYYNGTGGVIVPPATTVSGSRPKISIDNLTVTGVAATPCATPAAAPTALTFGSVTETTIPGSFTAASAAVNEYLVVMSTNQSLTSFPIDGQTYVVGDNVGDGVVVDKGSDVNFTATGLTGATTYYFFVFPVNSVCTGGPKYLTTGILTDDATTAAGLPACAAPAAQPTALGTVASVNSIQGSFTATAADEYLVLQSTSASLSGTPVNGTAYSVGAVLGNATVIQKSANTTFTVSSLNPATQYYYFIFSINSQNCVNGPVYNTVTPLTGTASTLPLPVCVTPASQPASLSFNASNNSVTGTFNATGAGGYNYLVVKSTSPTLTGAPADNTDYAAGDVLGGGNVVSNSISTSFVANNLSNTTTYYFFVFAANKNCSGGTKYLITAPLTGNATTTNAPVYNYYFGNLHAHSDYSDGNKDNPGYTPGQDYEYAKDALGFDFLGISEHNHFSSVDNPGNEVANYHLGVAQAAAFNATHTNFLALYGMEWGVISGGGHVVVYGDGLSDLFGWESNVNGKIGPNYDVYVPKSTYIGPTGLFKTVNDYVAKNAFATLAHPNNTDFNNLANIPYDSVADDAISGAAVESGVAFSTNTTYSNPASPMQYLSYFQKLLAKGYHLGPTIDHDNHNTTFGRTTPARTAVLAPALTQSDIIKAVRDMHFYATEDIDARVDFTINTRIMGSIFEDRNAPSISVNLTDPTTSTSNALIRVMYGKPGSGIIPVVIDSVFGSSLSYVDNNLANRETGYYYIDITNGGARIVTSPIWYTRTCASTNDVTIAACDSYTWAGTVYTTSTVVSKVFTTSGGCDSTVTLHLTINNSPSAATISLVGSGTGCPGAGVAFTANATAGSGAISSYEWMQNGTSVSTTAVGSFTALSSGSYSVKITDANNCSIASGAITATVEDLTAPVANQSNLPVITGQCAVTVTTVPTATDNCAGIVTATTADPLSYNAQGTYTIHWSYNDGNGNTSIQEQTVIVKDDTAPVANQETLPIISAECSVVVAAPTATDNCAGTITATTTDPVTYSTPGTYVIHWVYNDGNGNTTAQDQTVILLDITAPVITLPANISVNSDADKCGAIVSITPATATDACGIASVTGSRSDLLALTADYPVGTTLVKWTATDIHGNQTNGIQTITVTDHTAPVMTTTGNISVNTDAGKCGATISIATPSATDACGIASTVGVRSDALGLTADYPVGTTTITWTATDSHGNQSTATQTITVADTEKPVVVTNPVTVSLNVSGTASITAAQVNNNSSDNCGISSISVSPSTFSCANIGANTVTLTITDIHGNTNTATAVVTVAGSIPQVTVMATPSNNTYTGGVATNLYLGYGPTSVTLTPSVSGGSGYTYNWTGNGALSNNTAAAPVFTPTTAGYYTFNLSVTNANGCTAGSAISICVTDIRVAGTDGKKVYITHGGQTLSISVNAVAAHMAHTGDKLGSVGQSACSSGIAVTATQATTQVVTKESQATASEELTVTVSPNPSASYFTLQISSKSNLPVQMRVTDNHGRIIETKSGIRSNSSVKVGQNYLSGTYYAELIQGGVRKTVQLLKIRN
ncbi:MAG: cadherin-like beta sandwich domain-containing protein [Bacteroidota bacterium]